MRVLVTGSSGFIGAALCRALVEAGHSVRAFHRPTSNPRMLQSLPVEHALGDLGHPETLAEAAAGMEVVFHAAAQMGARNQDVDRMYAITVEGTRALLQASRKAGVRRLVHTSSVAALGVPERTRRGVMNAPMDETHTWNYRPEWWAYGYTKYLAEIEVQRALAEGLDAVIVNPAHVLGAGDVYRQSNSLVVRVAMGRLPVLAEGGLNVVHLQDVVAGHLAALEHGRTGERYILGGENLSIVELVEKIAAVAGVTPPRVVLPAGLMRSLAVPLGWLEAYLDLPVSAAMFRQAGDFYYYDTAKAQRDLNLPAPRPADEAIRAAYEWFVSVGAIPAADRQSIV